MCSPGRWFVYAGCAVGAFFFVERAAGGGAGLYVAFLEGCGAAAAVMVLFGLAQRLHAGDRLESAQLPGGVGAQFESSGSVEAVRGIVDEITTSMTNDLADIGGGLRALRTRVARLEELVLHGGDEGPAEE